MKKVLFVTTISGFLPQFEKNDAKILKEMGFEIHYASNFTNPIYTFDREELLTQGIITHQIDIEKSPTKFVKNQRTIKQIKTIIDENNIDMVHCHNPMGGVTARMAAAISHRKPYVIYTAHGFHFYKGAPLLNWILFYLAERILAHLTDQIITINREDYLRAERFHLKKGGKVSQIHGVGVDKNRFAPKKQINQEKRKELGIPQDAFHIVTAAELNHNKNQKVIIEAVAKLKNPKIHYSICGKGTNEAVLRALIREHHLEQQVHLLGYRMDMPEVLQTADCFAFPSYREGLGIAAIEALLCEVPLIAADNRGTREYAKEGKNALICHAGDIEAFAEAIRKLYTDTILRIEFSSVCRKSAQPFTIEEVEKTMKSIYKEAESHL